MNEGLKVNSNKTKQQTHDTSKTIVMKMKKAPTDLGTWNDS